MAPSIIILAAGKGSRMGSSIPKALQKIANKPMLLHILDTLKLVEVQQIIIVVGYQHELIQAACTDYKVEFAFQEQQYGTGHAVQCALPLVTSDKVIVLNADLPLVSFQTLSLLSKALTPTNMALLTSSVPDPQGFGRIIRNQHGLVTGIIEHADASPNELKIKEINLGLYAFPRPLLEKYLQHLKTHNKQQEFYLTDIIALAVKDQVEISAISAQDELETKGVNSFYELALLEKAYQLALIKKLQNQGVHIIDPWRLDIRGTLKVASDSVIDINVVFEGSCTVESFVHIGPNCYIKNAIIGKNTHILANSVIEDAVIGEDCVIGPFARLRPGTNLESKVKIGNFVEIKQAQIAEKTKINHLSYVGDAIVGRNVNIGAGVITCNYDGANKHQTLIEDDVFVGSNTEIVAPIKIGTGATVAAGTTVLKDVPAQALVLSKKIPTIIANWLRPKKK